MQINTFLCKQIMHLMSDGIRHNYILTTSFSKERVRKRETDRHTYRQAERDREPGPEPEKYRGKERQRECLEVDIMSSSSPAESSEVNKIIRPNFRRKAKRSLSR